MDTPPDLPAISDEDLLAGIRGQLAGGAPAAPATRLAAIDDQGNAPKLAPPLDYQGFVQGMTESESHRAVGDAAFARQMLARHLDFARRTEAGENPLDPDRPGDRQLWNWQGRAAGKPGLGTLVYEGAKSLGGDMLAAGQELDEIALQGTGIAASASPVRSALRLLVAPWTVLTSDEGDPVGASQRVNDLAVVSAAKALSFNNGLVRNLRLWAERSTRGTAGAAAAFGPVILGHPGIAKVLKDAAADTAGREALDDVYNQHAFEAARANYADDRTAETMHQRLALMAPVLQGIIGETEVNQRATNALSQLPQVAAEAMIARGVGLLGYATATTEFRAAQKAVAALRVEQAAAKAGLTAAISSGSGEAIRDATACSRTLENTIAVRTAKLAELSQKAVAEVEALTAAAASRVAAGAAMEKGGRFLAKAGGFAEALNALPRDLAARLAPDSEAARRLLDGAFRRSAAAGVGYAVDGPEGAVAGALLGGNGLSRLATRGLVGAGTDLARVGEIYSLGQATQPMAQTIRQARDISGFTRQAAAFLDNSVFAAGAKLGGGALEGAVSAGTFGAGLGAFNSPEDPLSGAASGAGGAAFLGAGVGALSQWRVYANPLVLARERAGQTRVYRDFLAARPEELAHFSRLDGETQEKIATYRHAMPDLSISYVDDPVAANAGAGPLPLPGEVTINVAAKDPLAGLIRSEIAHYVEDHGLADTVVRRALGDFREGIPGDYVERDAAGRPVVEMSADGKRMGYKLNAEFEAIRNGAVTDVETAGRLRGWSPEEIAARQARVADPGYIAREIFAARHLDYFQSPSFTRRGRAPFAPSDFVVNPAFLKNALGKLGVVFKPDGRVFRFDFVDQYGKSAAFQGLLREYSDWQAASARGEDEPGRRGTAIDKLDLSKESGYVERHLDASGEILRDSAGLPVYDERGRAILRPEGEAERDSREAGAAAIAQLDRAAAPVPAEDPAPVGRGVSSAERPTDELPSPEATPASEASARAPSTGRRPEASRGSEASLASDVFRPADELSAPAESSLPHDAAAGAGLPSPRAQPGRAEASAPAPIPVEAVQKRTSVEGKVTHAGRYLTDETLAAIEASGKLTRGQRNNLRQLNQELKAGFIREWTYNYQSPPKKGSGGRGTSAVKSSTHLVYGFKITADGDILVQSVPLDVLTDRATRAVALREAKLWNNSVGDLLRDVKTYVGNMANSRPGETGLTAEKVALINDLFGVRGRSPGDTTPLAETPNTAKTIVSSQRLDRINRLTPLGERNVPFIAESEPHAGEGLEALAGAKPPASPPAVRVRPEGMSPGQWADIDQRVSTRLPTGENALHDPIASQLSITAKDILSDPGKIKAVGNLLKKYPGLPSIGKAADVIARHRELAVSNLLWLHDQMPEGLRDRARKWYDGGRKIVERWSEEKGIPRPAVAGVIAVLSPLKEWHMNVDLARRVIEHHETLQGQPLSQELVDWYAKKFGKKAPLNAEALRASIGTKFEDLPLPRQALVLRAFDELLHPRDYRVVSPEGDFAGVVLKADGTPAKIAWGKFDAIEKAISVLNDHSRENISAQLGRQHKVRSFYNNLLLPFGVEHGDVTIDTHAVAAALLRPLAGSDLPVLHNFGGGAAPSSALTGASGLYGLYADAYREAALSRGLLPRELQSITWEAIRGMFRPKFKTGENKAAIDDLWRDYKHGNLNLDETRTRILDLTGGLQPPSWQIPDAGRHGGPGPAPDQGKLSPTNL